MWLNTFSLLTLAISTFGYSSQSGRLKEILSEFERKADTDFVKGCKGQPAEIVLVVDDSRSIYPPDFQKQILFLANFVKVFQIGPNDVRVAIVTYGDKIIQKSTFGLTTYTDETSLVSGISNIRFSPLDGDSTETAEAINYARTRILNEARPGIQKIVIVFTDGISSNSIATAHEAALIKDEGTLMVAIGVGERTSSKELNRIASAPGYVFQVSSYSMLHSIKKKLGMKTCQVPTTPPPPPTTPQMEQPCDKDIDINFVFDSGMMGVSGTNDAIKFIKSSISSQDLRKNNIKVGTVAGPCNKDYGFKLNRYRTKQEILQHLDQFHQIKLAPLITKTYTEAFSIANGGRFGARKVVVIFLKGKLSDPNSVIAEASRARGNGVEIFVVNMDNMNAVSTVESIASPKTANHILNANSGTNMVYLSGEFSNRLCRSLN